MYFTVNFCTVVDGNNQIVTLHASEAAAQCIVIGHVCVFVGLLPQ